MSSDFAIEAHGLAKCYPLFERPADRLKQMLWRGRQRYFREFWALRDVSATVGCGEVLGVVGRNGAGKSTLLQLICGTLTPTAGRIAVKGRVAALLELGAGFNPDFSGRENVYLAAAILGLSTEETDARFAAIVAFSGIGDFIGQPVKTYSSGMYVRLAFAIATSVDPDILVIDEALAVGDGAFARQSFDRIMALKAAGKTILFCSHALYQIEALCSRALWLEGGRTMLCDTPARVVAAYQDFLGRDGSPPAPTGIPPAVPPAPTFAAPTGTARLLDIAVLVDGVASSAPTLISRRSTLGIRIAFAADPALPTPSVAVGLHTANGLPLATAGSHNDGATLSRTADGLGSAQIDFPACPLLKGRYRVSVWLMCEAGLHMYESADFIATLDVVQHDLEQGLVSLPHRWLT